jgi:D-glycero-D-manno-heptose 1,7-bisphosphate phosphatase
MSTNAKRKAIFIDRDGTLIEEVNFLSRIEDLQFFPFTDEAVSILKNKGYLLIVVTNQSGIGRGIYSEADMHSIHEEIQNRLSAAIDAFYFCPHLPDEGCACRKPALGMIRSACVDFDIDLADSWMIGDKKLDVETGINASLRTAMVLTGYGENDSRMLEGQPDVLAKNLLEAAKAIADFKYSDASSN